MFKQQPLSFHEVSETFITQNYLFVIPNNILCFTCHYCSCLAHFKTGGNRGKHSSEKNNIVVRIILMAYINALTQTRSN